MRYLWAALAGILLLCGESHAQQKVWSIACGTAVSSDAADENLAKLKGLDPSGDGVSQAISTCAARVNTLKQQEQKDWDSAIATRNSGDCNNAKRQFQAVVTRGGPFKVKARDEISSLGSCADKGVSGAPGASSNDGLELTRAQGAFGAGNYPQARSIAAPLVGKPGVGDEARKLIARMDDIDETNRLVSEAFVAANRKEISKACADIAKLEAKPSPPKELTDLKQRAGTCPTVPVAIVASGDSAKADSLKNDYESAVKLREAGRFKDAETAFKRLAAANPNYRDVNDLLVDVHKEALKADQGTVEQRLAQLIATARDFYQKGDLSAAMGRLQTANTLKPNDPGVQKLTDEVQAGIKQEDADLGSAIAAFYKGDYGGASQMLSLFVSRPRAARIMALATFYIGASAASEYHLNGLKPEKKDEAKRAFAMAVKDYPSFTPDWTALSPKIRMIFSEATGMQ